MFPENVDRGQQENEETSNPVPPPHFLNHSSEDEEAGTMASVSMTGQYQLLSQGQVQSTSESDSDSDSDEGTGSTSWHAQFEWNEVQDTQDAVNRIDLEEPLNQENDAKYVDEQSSTREWNRTDDLPERPNIELNQEHIDSIKGCMSQISFPDSAVPSWATVVPEEKMIDFIYNKLKLSKSE